jgi:hypothetical protein
MGYNFDDLKLEMSSLRFFTKRDNKEYWKYEYSVVCEYDLITRQITVVLEEFQRYAEMLTRHIIDYYNVEPEATKRDVEKEATVNIELDQVPWPKEVKAVVFKKILECRPDWKSNIKDIEWPSTAGPEKTGTDVEGEEVRVRGEIFGITRSEFKAINKKRIEAGLGWNKCSARIGIPICEQSIISTYGSLGKLRKVALDRHWSYITDQGYEVARVYPLPKPDHYKVMAIRPVIKDMDLYLQGGGVNA